MQSLHGRYQKKILQHLIFLNDPCANCGGWLKRHNCKFFTCKLALCFIWKTFLLVQLSLATPCTDQRLVECLSPIKGVWPSSRNRSLPRHLYLLCFKYKQIVPPIIQKVYSPIGPHNGCFLGIFVQKVLETNLNFR